MHFFEGSEKKFEIVLKKECSSLLLKERSFWEEIVNASNAEILSVIESDNIKAYLLSESSLIIMKNHFVMITCGQTMIINAIEKFLEKFLIKDIDSVIFQRKNEYQSFLQKTSFMEDVKKISSKISGKAFRFGNMDGHHNYIFHMDKPFIPNINDYTHELLMYHINGEAKPIFNNPNTTIEEIRNLLKLENLFPQFEFDDYLFKPYGYSMNAIHHEQYLTIHITPQENNSYVSFETNINLNILPFCLLEYLIEKIQPTTFDTISFNLNTRYKFHDKYKPIIKVKDSLTCGYNIQFVHYSTLEKDFQKPVQL